MGRVCATGNHRIVFMEHGSSTDRVEAEQRYLAYRSVMALETIAGCLNSLLLALFFGFVIYTLAEVAVNLLHKGDA